MVGDTQQVYVSDAVSAITRLYGYLAAPDFRARSIAEQIDRQARTLQVAHRDGDRRVLFQIWSWWPGAARAPAEDIMAAAFGLDQARLTIAREYGFQDWATVEALGEHRTDPTFEAAVDRLLVGDLEGLRETISIEPGLERARSAYGHQSTLLHYLGANGVESYRQVTPLNAVALAGLLIDFGADVNAEANMYGGGQTAFTLAMTSAHPAEAGVIEQLAAVLKPRPD